MLKSPEKYTILDSSDQRWLEFASTNSEANIFHHPAWSRVLAECYGYHPFVVAVADEHEQITAGLPVMEVKNWLTGWRWVALPFADHCIPLYRDEQAFCQLTDALGHLFTNKHVPRIELRWQYPNHPDMISESQYVLHILPLDSDSEFLESRLKRSHRQNINAARKRGVRVERGTGPEHVRIFYELQLQTRHRHGVPMQPRKFFDLIASRLIEQGLGFILLAYHEDECIAGGLFLHWQKSLTYKYNASTENGLRFRPNNLLCWTAIEWGCENGFTSLDFGRAKIENEGLRRFKNGWGAEERPLGYCTFCTKRLRQDHNDKFWQLMQMIIRRSPTWMCQAIGELLYGQYG